MLIGPRNIGAVVEVFRRQAPAAEQQGALDHVRFRQHQLWSSSSAILTFDGVMTAALAFGDQGHRFFRPVTLAFLASAALSVFALNLHGGAGGVRSIDHALDLSVRDLKLGAGLCLAALWISLAATVVYAFMIIQVV
jgi:hypothetical protein